MIPYHPTPRADMYFYQGNPETVAMTAAFVFLVVCVVIALKRYGWPGIRQPRQIVRFFFLTIFSSLAVGRLWYYAERWNGLQTFVEIFDLRVGGLISVGMIIGAFLGMLLFCWIRKRDGRETQLEFARLTDILIPFAALILFIYRLFGCSIYGLCTKGQETAVPWALYWVNDAIARHPVTFYLALSALFIFIVLRLFFGYKRIGRAFFGKRFDGEVAFWFLLLYFFNRFWIEFLRIDKVMYGPLNLVQWVSLVVIAIVVHELAMYYYTMKKLKIGSLEGYASYLRKHTWVGQHVLFWRMAFAGKRSRPRRGRQ